MSKDQLVVSAAFDQASDAMIITDAAEKIVWVNRKFVDLSGYEPDEIIGQTPAILRSGKNDPKLFTTVWSTINAAGHWRGEIWDRKKNGRLFIADLTISAIVNHHGKVSHYLGVYRDITAAREEEMKRTTQETREPQTFLLNRPAFFQQLSEICAAAKPADGVGALLLVNLDKFHTINEQHGIAAGDIILYEAARRLRKSLRDSDVIGRLDGDEFGVVIPAAGSLEDIEKITEKLLERLLAPYDLGQQKQVEVSCSIGLTPLNSRGIDVDTLIRSADRALREAKTQKGGCWRTAETTQTKVRA
jgi:diguanylate cyclase (GGDEF)-like protein/PAS domain S-box-containing protein